MTRLEIEQSREAGEKLPAEQWGTIKSEACARAQALRRQMLRDVAGWIVDRPLALLRRFRDWHARYQAVRELQDLDNRILRDMGIARSEIEYLVAGGDAERRRPKTPVAEQAPCAAQVAARSRDFKVERCAA